jgi:hypothetical protein
LSHLFYGETDEESMSRALQGELAGIVRQRRQIAADIHAAQEKAATAAWSLPSPGGVWGPGTSATDSIMRGMEREAAAAQEAELRRRDMGRRAECVRKAKDLTLLLEDRWGRLTAMFGELRVRCGS